MCQVDMLDDDNNTLGTSQGYVPRDLGIGGGDYIKLTIDTKTGRIDGWKPLSKNKINKILF